MAECSLVTSVNGQHQWNDWVEVEDTRCHRMCPCGEDEYKDKKAGESC